MRYSPESVFVKKMPVHIYQSWLINFWNTVFLLIPNILDVVSEPVNTYQWVNDTRYVKQYIDLHTTKRSYSSAITLCHGVGGILPEPRNSEQHNFLRSMQINRWFYLGLSRRATDGHWVWTSDGTRVTWNLWDSGQPVSDPRRTCGAMYLEHGRWFAGWCVYTVEGPPKVVCEKTSKYTIYYETKQTNQLME